MTVAYPPVQARHDVRNYPDPTPCGVSDHDNMVVNAGPFPDRLSDDAHFPALPLACLPCPVCPDGPGGVSVTGA